MLLPLATQLRIRLFVLFAVFFGLALFTLWKGETIRAKRDVETLLAINYRDVSTGFTDRADYQLSTIARDLANRLGTSGKLAEADPEALCEEEDIAEIYDVDARGVVAGGTRIVGADMHAGAQSSFFLRLLEPDGPATLSQPEMPRTSDGKVFKYAAARFPDGSGYLEVGWTEEHFLKYLRQRAYGYTRSWHIDENGFIVFVDSSGTITSHTDMSLAGRSLLEATGLDPAAIPTGTLFRATVSGREMFCLAGPVRDYLAVLVQPVDDAFASRDRFMPRMALIQLAVFAALFAFVSLMLRNRVSLAVRRIGGALRRIADGDLAGKADVRTSKEFSELSDNINATVDALRAAAAERMRRIEAELELGRTIQRSALPATCLAGEGFRLEASMQAAREVGGDFYDFFALDPTHQAFLVADVSGKGVTAALYMMTAKSILKDAILALRDPAAAFEKANGELCASNPANMFLTAWAGVIDLESGEVVYANAGHNPPAVRRADGSVESLAARSGPLLAVVDGAAYKPKTVRLVPGDAVFLYTDGVTEAQDPSHALFGDDRFLEALRAAPLPNDPAVLVSRVRSAVEVFERGAPPADDLTVLALSYTARAVPPPHTFARAKESLPLATAYLHEALSRGGCGEADRRELEVVLDEIAGNIVSHSDANAFEVTVEFRDGPRRVVLGFADDGFAFDPLARPDPDTTLSAADRPVGGLGIFMVKRLAADVRYERKRNRNFLFVTKNLRPPEG